MPTIVIDQEKCNQCGGCVALCNASNVFEQDNRQTKAVKPDECWLCGHCVAVCPTDAIDHSEFSLAEGPVLDPSRLPAWDSLVAAFRARRSARTFKDKPVPRQVVNDLAGIARWVPSASNAQPVDWLAVDDPTQIAALSAQTVEFIKQKVTRLTTAGEQAAAGLEDVEDFERIIRQFAAGIDPIFFKAPLLLLAHVPDDDEFGRDDATYAAYNLILAAESIGLGTCLIGYFIFALDNSEKLRSMLALPDRRKVEVALVLGYPKYRFRRFIPRRKMEIVWNSVKTLPSKN
jgi:nitroreductase/NAD-dependent dihydropyrimidine dehydrogenase PreA subunit